ncbi:MAG: hypothetical protein ACW967_09205 [Candidatus Hodarchaeales archaeon]
MEVEKTSPLLVFHDLIQIPNITSLVWCLFNKKQRTEKKGDRPFGFFHGFPNFNQLIKAGIGDQCSWLSKYNSENAFCRPIKMGIEDPELFSIQNRTGYIWTGSILTLSDIDRNGSTDWRYNTLFGKPERRFFEIVDEHHLLILDGFYICGYDKEFNVTWIVYGVASRFKNKSGKLVSNYPILKSELIPMATAVKFVPFE